MDTWTTVKNKLNEDVPIDLKLNDGDKIVGVFVGEPALRDGPRVAINFWTIDGALRIFETNGETFKQVLTYHETVGLAGHAFHLHRCGESIAIVKGEPLGAETQKLVAELVPHKLDAKKSKKEPKEPKPAATNGNPVAAAQPAASTPVAGVEEFVDDATKTRLGLRLRDQGAKTNVDAFLAHFAIQKMGQLKKSDVAEAEAMIEGYEKAKAAPEVVDPFS